MGAVPVSRPGGSSMAFNQTQRMQMPNYAVAGMAPVRRSRSEGLSLVPGAATAGNSGIKATDPPVVQRLKQLADAATAAHGSVVEWRQKLSFMHASGIPGVILPASP